VKTARTQYWPALKDLSMYSLRMREDAMREPHWHPVPAELGYVHTGSARMTVMDPDGTLDTWYMNQGDMYFVPRAYPHHIEVVDAPDLHFAIFFDQPTPGTSATRLRRAPTRVKCWRRLSTSTSTICPTFRSPRRTR
jgi:oxalate decarboxylase